VRPLFKRSSPGRALSVLDLYCRLRSSNMVTEEHNPSKDPGYINEANSCDSFF
jgi:hypothetical protein